MVKTIVSLIKRRKPELLHRRALNLPNRDEGEQRGDDDLLVHVRFVLFVGESFFQRLFDVLYGAES